MVSSGGDEGLVMQAFTLLAFGRLLEYTWMLFADFVTKQRRYTPLATARKISYVTHDDFLT